VDIDNFKRLNTRHTETIIDETILPDAMKLIQNLIRLRGGAYRHGGEEFLVILPNSDSSEATAFAEKLRSAFESTDFKVKEQVERLTISIGIALWPQHGTTYDELLKTANEAESEAKHTKNTCVLAKK
jgi:diguanylate cyclase (GGDEF)-like protein